jgi:hypothetical protein
MTNDDDDKNYTIKQFCQQHGITIENHYADSNPNFTGEWERNASHYRCVLKRGRKRMTVAFSQGSAHTQEPAAHDVLYCLQADTSSVDNAGGFQEWARDLGYDPDSRKAESTYRACERAARKLRQFMGELFESFMQATE